MREKPGGSWLGGARYCRSADRFSNPPGFRFVILVMTGWANYYGLGQVSPAYRAIDCHAVRRLRQWLCRRHKVRSGGTVRFTDERLRQQYGLTCPVSRTKSFPWAKA